MRNIVQENKQFLIAFFGILLIILSGSIFVSNATMDTEAVLIQSITPVYDEEGTYSVGNTGVIFNDKDQVVKYNVVVQNNENYDVKVSDLQLGTKTEEFLKYTVENIELDDVIKAGESKELIVSFETVKMDGWGRNFNDELVTTLVFDRVLINTEQTNPSEPVNPQVPNNTNNNQNNEVPKVEIVPDNSGNIVVQPEGNEPVIEEPKEEVNNEVVITPEDDVNHELGINEQVIIKENNTGDMFVIYCFGIATGVLGVGLLVVNKNKFTKYIVLFVIVGSSVKLASANEVFSLEIPINVSYESQNVMMANGCELIPGRSDAVNCKSYWQYSDKIKNFYIKNEIIEMENYIYEFDVSEEQNERVIAYLLENKDDPKYYDLYLQADGIIYANEDASFYFSELYRLKEIVNLQGLSTSKSKNMSYMFTNSGYYEGLELDLSSFDTSNVTDMSWMFANSQFGGTTITLDLSNLDTSNVTDMSGMFVNVTSYNTTFSIDLTGLDTSKVTNMSQMFHTTGSNIENFYLELTGLDTSKVTDMSQMFARVGYNTTNFILDLSSFDTSNVTNMSAMFSMAGDGCPNFTLDVSNFDTGNVTNMQTMFGLTGQNNPNFTLDISHFDTSKVTNMSKMFLRTGYNSIELNTTITIKNPNIDEYSNMFNGVATNEGSQITVNYTSETESIVDQMIATKSSNSNVVKGWNVDVPIVFTVDGKEYNAYEGMTWEQWIDSELNTDGYFASENRFWLNIDGISKSISYVDVNGPYAGDKIVGEYNYVLVEVES